MSCLLFIFFLIVSSKFIAFGSIWVLWWMIFPLIVHCLTGAISAMMWGLNKIISKHVFSVNLLFGLLN